jgi:molybdate transport system substrate-binding protein
VHIGRFVALVGVVGVVATPVRAEPVSVYSAGSLRRVVAALSVQAAALGIEIRPTFDGAGALRARIEKGETPDLFLSADMAAPRALARSGRAKLAAVAFARNQLCVVASPATGLTAANLVATMLAPSVRIKTSVPKADPAGDYAMALFDRIDAARPGSGAVLRGKALREMNDPVAAKPGENGTAALFRAQRIDMAVTYCSAVADLRKTVPELRSVPVPTALDPHPVYGLALLTTAPDAARLALLLLSESGQAAIAAAGLLPLASGG